MGVHVLAWWATRDAHCVCSWRCRSAARVVKSRAITLEVAHMTCGSCVASVERALRALPFVEGADINLATKTAVVEVDAGGPRDCADELLATLDNAGYGGTLLSDSAAGCVTLPCWYRCHTCSPTH